jgi:hypothetical protein
MYLDLIKEDNEIRAKGVAAKVLAKWKSQGGRRHIAGSYGPPVKMEIPRSAVDLPPSSSSGSGSGSGGVDLVSVTSSLSSSTISSAPPPAVAATVTVVPPPYLANIKFEFPAPPSRAESSDQFVEYGESERNDNY